MTSRLQPGAFPICRRQRFPLFGVGFMAFLCALKLSGQIAPSPVAGVAFPGTPAPRPPAAAPPQAETTNAAPLPPVTASITSLSDITNIPASLSNVIAVVDTKPVSDIVLANVIGQFTDTNGLPRNAMSPEEFQAHLTHQLETARYLRTTRQPREAEPLLIGLLMERSSELIRQSAMLELAALAQDENDLLRAQQIYAQFLSRWPNDLRIPEILLRQGLLFRQLGLYNLAFTKFYGVMTSALVLKNDQFDYYVRLVLQAQTEIAETQYELGKYADAAEFFSRLLKQNNPGINKPLLIYRLARCHSALGRYAETVSDAQEYLARYPNGPEQPEVRFHLANALKELGRNSESLQQVLLLLQEQRMRTKGSPESWAYWQQRTGNIIANQLYREGDYTKALEIYLSLAKLDGSLLWQLPVQYQIGMTYERLWQPQKATEAYQAILSREKELGAEVPPSLKTVIDMARWRIGFIQWQSKAEAANRRVHSMDVANSPPQAGLPAAPAAPAAIP